MVAEAFTFRFGQMLRTTQPSYCYCSFALFYLWGFTLSPHAEGIYKNSKVLWNLCGYLSEGNFRNPSVSDELQASRLP